MRQTYELNMTLSGEITDVELREAILTRIQRCHSDELSGGCPFRLLRKISYLSCLNLVAGMQRETMIDLLKGNCHCAEEPNGNFCGQTAESCGVGGFSNRPRMSATFESHLLEDK
jgi:hypothetical protein